jgi:hypothetical protein
MFFATYLSHVGRYISKFRNISLVSQLFVARLILIFFVWFSFKSVECVVMILISMTADLRLHFLNHTQFLFGSYALCYTVTLL